MTEFTPLPMRTGTLLDLRSDAYPTLVRGWNDGGVRLEGNATHYGLVSRGSVMLTSPDSGPLMLSEGMYFVQPGEALLAGHGGAGMVITRLGYTGLRQFGGPVEGEGRLRYIDGCSDTLLVCPPRLGEPCLNHLHIPEETEQSAHTHPTARIGVILEGRGECRTGEESFPLEPGMGWYIPPGCLHAFVTEGECLDVLAWHPDSDFGPTDEDHPMINRTLLPETEG